MTDFQLRVLALICLDLTCSGIGFGLLCSSVLGSSLVFLLDGGNSLDTFEVGSTIMDEKHAYTP